MREGAKRSQLPSAPIPRTTGGLYTRAVPFARERALDARVAELVDAADSDKNLSPRGEIPGVKPVKLGEGP